MSNDSGGSTTSPSGLGRPLGGILGNALTDERGPGVSSLLGVHAARRTPEVRKLVTEMALQAIADSFGTLGAMLVRRHEGHPATAVRSKIPADWAIDDPVGFEVAGRLWRALDDNAVAEIEQVELSGHHLLVVRQHAGDATVAAAILRLERFDQRDQQILLRLLRSVSAALGDSSPIPAGFVLDVTVGETSPGNAAAAAHRDRPASTAVVALAPEPAEGPAMVATASARSQAEAAAAAALRLCAFDAEVRFAGSSVLDDHRVDLVVIAESGGGPLFGLAIGAPDSASGPAEAAIAAAIVAGASPLGPTP